MSGTREKLFSGCYRQQWLYTSQYLPYLGQLPWYGEQISILGSR